MSGFRTITSLHRGIERARAASRPSRIVDWLHLAATPTFGLMALFTEMTGTRSMGMLCPAAHATSPMGGMVVMYLLMAALHAGPWLNRIRLPARTKQAGDRTSPSQR